ncbi:heavy-metal-associated domain-containing protein [Lysobacter niastensis]|uniref:Heavy-metal-associated domain-containing protein n=1 Tax=Lysobacter niastensis TaxID=380629 RepID=A0ABS0BB07_9GAMM|nr:heavy-metal-associated domain-containing protein [Lysobacter niastensis]MBF6024852.1 heavy-metal-associated domain-containing protein [Lysobacter niastensis]
MKLIVEGMTCGRCVRAITTAIQRLDPSALVHVDLTTEEVCIDSPLDVNSAVKAIHDEGYSVVSILGDDAPSDTAPANQGSCCGTCHA